MSYKKNKYRRSSKRGKPPAPYKSWLEHDLHTKDLKHLLYEPTSIPYIVKKKYKPDFVNESKKIIFEAKGRFKDSTEASKYVHFRQCNPEWTLIFIFERPSLPMPYAKRRADGTRQTHAEWAERNKFLWCSKDTIRKEWL